MKPLSSYCNNCATQTLTHNWGERLEKMQTPAKEFLVSLIGNALFLNCYVSDIAEEVMRTPKVVFVSDHCEEISSFRDCSRFELAKIIEFLAASIAEDYQKNSKNS